MLHTALNASKMLSNAPIHSTYGQPHLDVTVRAQSVGEQIFFCTDELPTTVLTMLDFDHPSCVTAPSTDLLE